METQQVQNNNLQPKLSIGFFFLSLGLLIGLFTTIISFLGLVFEVLDKKFPDVLNATYQYGYNPSEYSSIRAFLSTLIIFFPVFLIIHYFWDKKVKQGLVGANILVRKWFLYAVLFIASLVVVIDLVTLVRYFVGGEITSRFIYKVLVVLLLTVFVGGYYILEILNKNKISIFKVGLTAAIKSSILVLLLIMFTFSVIGTPNKQRLLRLDNQKVNDLSSIQWQVINYYQQKQKLPKNIEDLVDPISGYFLPPSPELGVNYEYKLIDENKLTFSLCSTFNLNNEQGWVENSSYVRDVSDPSVGGMNQSWVHEAGYQCFERTIDKDIYPPFEKPILR